MGACMTGIIEWTHDAQCAARFPAQFTLDRPRWEDDYLHGMLFETDKEYDFFAATAGARNRFGRPPLTPARGVPTNLSIPARRHFEFQPELAGWLHLSEIDAAIAHIRGDEEFHMGFELEVAMETMRIVVSRLADAHVRMVFDISGA